MTEAQLALMTIAKACIPHLQATENEIRRTAFCQPGFPVQMLPPTKALEDAIQRVEEEG